jgi:hypothetical protein
MTAIEKINWQMVTQCAIIDSSIGDNEMKKILIEILQATIIACFFFAPMAYYLLFVMKP